MSSQNKPEFPPLLPAGLHQMTVADVQGLCVTAFPLSQTRQVIFAGLQSVITELTISGVRGEMWVDGSFLTQKIDPEDVDLVAKVPSTFYDTCTAQQRAKIDWINGNLKVSHFCDSYLWVEFPVGHQHYWNSEWQKAYWIKQFGFTRGQNLKGIAVVTL
jgi:hypothetical protein